ncbi:cytochrome P450 [Mycena sp. CBHHK59/15]|nr:cytochrome P450 [Mycena sp. CBHHK59/15]KAJ6614546.1 cytochrome P450 [Mycena sp. CBHHK59/15]
MPSVEEWVTFAKWGAKWGGICSVTLLGQPIVILNSVSAMEQLDAKGSIYNSRPRLPMAGELVGYVDTLVLMPYGARFRTFRKYFARLIGTPGAMRQYIPVVESETRRFLRRLLLKPDAEKISEHVRKLTGAIILRITYGIEVQEEEDPFVTLIEKANDNFNLATAPGAFLVDVFPVLLYLPEWLAPFKRTARIWARATKSMIEAPYLFVRRQMDAGTAPVSFVSSLLEEEERMSTEDVQDVKYTASSLYGGGADTTAASVYAFFLVMVLYPDVQRRAQAEIDLVLGGERLPIFSDHERLPYVSAVVTELLRWHSVAPLGVPHAALEDGIIDDNVIPKGSIIIANLWNMLHDASTYPDPFTFDPTRHIASPDKPAQRDPRTICFGFGRRICPGSVLAEASVFHCVASTLAVFDVSKAVERGVPITPVHENMKGTISHPKPFKCVVTPRSEKAFALIIADS